MNNTDNIKILVDKDKCIVCGLCAQLYPDIFELDNNEIKVIGTNAPAIQEIVDMCPSGALSVKNSSDASTS